MPGRRLPVVFDTNPLQAEGWLLTSESMRIVEHEAQKGAMSLYISAVTRLELVRHGMEQARLAANRYRESAALLMRLGSAESLDRGVELRAEAYEQRLDARLREIGVEILAVPDVSHNELLLRALDGQKPFKEKGRGYKDALIWLGVVELLRVVGPPLAFVTKDGDFRDGQDLTADLVQDLVATGYDNTAVRLYGSVGEMIAAEVPEIRAAIARIQRLLAEDAQFRERLVAWMVTLVDQEGPPFIEAMFRARLGSQPTARISLFSPTRAPGVEAAFEPSNGTRPLELSLQGDLAVFVSFDPRDIRLPCQCPLGLHPKASKSYATPSPLSGCSTPLMTRRRGTSSRFAFARRDGSSPTPSPHRQPSPCERRMMSRSRVTRRPLI